MAKIVTLVFVLIIVNLTGVDAKDVDQHATIMMTALPCPTNVKRADLGDVLTTETAELTV